jgi:hypothetical protein
MNPLAQDIVVDKESASKGNAIATRISSMMIALLRQTKSILEAKLFKQFQQQVGNTLIM